MLVNDLDADLAAERPSAEIERRHGRLRRGDLTQEGVSEALVEKAVDGVRPARHRREQRRLHVGRDRAQDVATSSFARCSRSTPSSRSALLRAACPVPARAAAKQEREEGREVFRKVVNVTSISGTQGQRRPGQLLGRRRPALVGHHEDARRRVGAVQGERERRRVRASWRRG